MNSRTQAIKKSNDQAIAAWDKEIQTFKDLVDQYKDLGKTQPPKPEDRVPGTWGAGKSGT